MSKKNKVKIWFGDPSPESIAWMDKDTLSEALGIRITEITNDSLIGTMPVDQRTRQPFGLLHGGASVALAETLGSVATYLTVNPEYFIGVGVEINANHLRAVKNGIVKGVCQPIHVSGRTHVWEIKIYNEKEDLCCICRFTCSIAAIRNIPD
jgi:1,4-dihydroxy-2-naphthoyl-CoA hydrolase